MRAADEAKLFERLAGGAWPRDAIHELQLVPKAAWRTLEKWARKGWYEWGVVLDLGWLTTAGEEEAVRRGHVLGAKLR